jgi:hypothetical protein
MVGVLLVALPKTVNHNTQPETVPLSAECLLIFAALIGWAVCASATLSRRGLMFPALGLHSVSASRPMIISDTALESERAFLTQERSSLTACLG